jgi:hypothetical protein
MIGWQLEDGGARCGRRHRGLGARRGGSSSGATGVLVTTRGVRERWRWTVAVFRCPVLIALGVAGCGLVALPVVASASAGFGVPVLLRSPETIDTSRPPAVAVNSSGQVVVGWGEIVNRGTFAQVGVVVRRGVVSGRFGPLEQVSRTGFFPAVAAVAGGGAAALWLTHVTDGKRGIQAAVAVGRGQFGPPQTLATARAGIGYQYVFATGGRYVAIWREGVPGRSHDLVRYAETNASGRFGAPRTLATNADWVYAAADPEGNVTVAWEAGPFSVGGIGGFATLASGASVFAVGGALPAYQLVGVDVGPGGTALALLPASGDAGPLSVAPLAAGLAPAPDVAYTLDPADVGILDAGAPAVALPGGGLPPVAAFALVQDPDPPFTEIQKGTVFATQPAADGVYGAPVQLSTTGTIATQPIAGATESTAVVVWTTGGPANFGLEYALRSGPGQFGAAHSLSSARSAGAPALASSNHAVVAAWTTANDRGIDLATLQSPPIA